MRVLFIGNFQGPGNNTGEEPDERHIAKSLAQAGVDVTTVPRDEVHAWHIGAKKENIPEEGAYDIILLCKWGNFTQDMIRAVKERYKGKLVYWVWDFMYQPHREFWTPDWHKMLLHESDYYISGERDMVKAIGGNYRYFNWDTADGQYDQLPERTDDVDVAFTGTYIPHSYRNEWLEDVNKRFNLTIFSFDHEVWKTHGFKAEPGKYGADYNQISARAKVILCMNWVEPMPESFGYWSNRVGKVMTTGGLPLIHYVPGMERALSDAPMYFHDKGDLFNKLSWLLGNDEQRETARVKAYDFGRRQMTTQIRMRELKVLLESLL